MGDVRPAFVIAGGLTLAVAGLLVVARADVDTGVGVVLVRVALAAAGISPLRAAALGAAREAFVAGFTTIAVVSAVIWRGSPSSW